MNTVIEPGAVVGVLGSGQLGRMFAIAARRMGYRVHTLSPDADTPTGQVADVEVRAAYGDLDAIRRFASGVSVVTFEFENVPSAAAEAAAEFAPVRPAGRVLHVTQQRLREKTYLAGHGFPVAPFRHVRTRAELDSGLADLGGACILKTAGYGYDGKGQARLNGADDAAAAWEALAGAEAVLEKRIDFAAELSVVAARALDGSMADYGPVANTHTNGILDLTLAPAPVDPRTAAEACAMARAVLESLDVVGVLCVEFFLDRSGRLLINELAPRPHNSGHFTFDACVTSQFEQQLRAVCGLPLGSTDLMRPAAMVNLLGDLWDGGTPNWDAACRFPSVKLHLYGKLSARPGRKMGHITALAATAEAAAGDALAARAALTAVV